MGVPMTGAPSLCSRTNTTPASYRNRRATVRSRTRSGSMSASLRNKAITSISLCTLNAPSLSSAAASATDAAISGSFDE